MSKEKQTTKKGMYNSLLLHIPHSGVEIPNVFGDKNPKYIEAIHQEILDWGLTDLLDLYTAELFAPGFQCRNIQCVVAPINRLIVDMERMRDDPLEDKGYGIVSKYARRWFDAWEVEDFGMEAYDAYHEMLAETLSSMDKPLLIDCHSFSSHPTALCTSYNDVDICIGVNDDETFPGWDVVHLVERHFADLGYRVGVNTPFSNSKTAEGATGYHSLMIEVNKRRYMDASHLRVTGNAATVKKDLLNLYAKLLGAHVNK